MAQFIGRKEELKGLAGLLKKGIATLVVIKGRRRIGKSRLVEEFAKNHTFYHFAGSPPTVSTTKQSQLDEFARQLSAQGGLPEVTVNDWSSLFILLAERTAHGQVIILFDEISWMGSKDPDFLGKLKNAWDIYFKKNPKLILILCGSVSTWIDKNILASTGFVGRISYRLTLHELPLLECNEFWRRNSHISSFEKLKVLAITGGVPRYLEEIDPLMPAENNIQRLCFEPTGLLVHEFGDIFSDIFSRRSETYKRIVEVLVQGAHELKDISKALGIKRSGFLSSYLDDLVKSGFVKRDYAWHISSGQSSELSMFRLSDNYVRFYLKYIEKKLTAIEKNTFKWTSLSALPGWNSILGLQFENLVLNNRRYIMDCLETNLYDVVADGPFFQRKTQRAAGCQIDYLIQTKFNGLFLCEFKFSQHEVKPSVIDEVKKKMDRLVHPKGFSLWPVLVHVNGVSEAVADSGFFTKIINFSDILTPMPSQGSKE
jgi:uncharacterized protein